MESNNNRRHLLKSALGTSVLAVWHKPIISSVVLPAHAQTSRPLAPDVLAGNVLFGPVSGTNTPPVCQATFDVLSSDPTQALTIVSITDDNADPDTTITYDSFGVATDSMGPRVVWRGPASDAPFCTDLMPITDITFTVTVQSEATGSMEFTQNVMLSAILA